MRSRKPIPVEPDVEKVLDDWQRRRATTNSVFAKFTYTYHDQAFKKECKSTGSLRYRHPDAGRIDIRNWSAEIWSKNNEFWSANVPERRIAIFEWSDPKQPSDPMLFGVLQDSQWVWLTPSDKLTIQKQGKVTKVSEDAQTVVLRVERTERAYSFFSQVTVHLRKSDLLPSKIVVMEDVCTECTYVFTEMLENPEIDDTQFAKPKFEEGEWKITRQRITTQPPQKHSVPGSGKKPSPKANATAKSAKPPSPFSAEPHIAP